MPSLGQLKLDISMRFSSRFRSTFSSLSPVCQKFHSSMSITPSSIEHLDALVQRSVVQLRLTGSEQRSRPFFFFSSIYPCSLIMLSPSNIKKKWSCAAWPACQLAAVLLLQRSLVRRRRLLVPAWQGPASRARRLHRIRVQPERCSKSQDGVISARGRCFLRPLCGNTCSRPRVLVIKVTKNSRAR